MPLCDLQDSQGTERTLAAGDVTEAKLAEQQLRDQAALLELSHDAILVRSLDGQILFWNRGAIDTYGFTREAAIGASAADLLNTEFPLPAAEIQSLLEQGSEWEGELGHRRQDGKHIVVSSRWSLLRDGDGTPRAVMEINREITDRKQTAAKVAAERERFNGILDVLPPYVILLTPDYHVAFANREFRRRFGEPRGRACYEFLFGRSSPCEVCETYKVLKSGNPLQWEWTGPDGRDYEIHDFPFVDTDGASLILEMGVDVTDRKRAERMLQEASRYTRSLIEASLDPLVTIDREGNITDVNQATEKATGVNRDRLIGSEFAQYFTDPDKARKGYQQVFTTGFVRDYPLAIRHASGGVVEVLYNASIFRNGTGEVAGVFAAARDITARKRAEQALSERAAELARSNAELQQFAYVASHDLQEPLRMVANYTQLLARRYRGRLDPDADEFIAYAVEGATRMEALIQALLAYSRVTTQAQVPMRVSPDRILSVALANLTVAIQESGAIITSDPMPDVMADEVQLMQVFQNLVGNALKFRRGEPCQIHIAGTARGHECIFSVRDNGVGIAPEHHDRIFGLFQRLQARAAYPGTGMGLAICKKIAERHGGRIWVESEPGEGSTFYFTLPLALRNGGKS